MKTNVHLHGARGSNGLLGRLYRLRLRFACWRRMTKVADGVIMLRKQNLSDDRRRSDVEGEPAGNPINPSLSSSAASAQHAGTDKTVAVRDVTADGQSCDILRNCDRNARCEFSEQTRAYSCQCNPGYTGKSRVRASYLMTRAIDFLIGFISRSDEE